MTPVARRKEDTDMTPTMPERMATAEARLQRHADELAELRTLNARMTEYVARQDARQALEIEMRKEQRVEMGTSRREKMMWIAGLALVVSVATAVGPFFSDWIAASIGG